MSQVPTPVLVGPHEALYDRNGIPIRAGDLIRRRHYVHYRNRRMCYIHDVVFDSPTGLRCIAYDETARGEHDGYSMEMVCRLWHVEVIAGCEITFTDVVRFFERPKNRPMRAALKAMGGNQ